MDPTSCRLLVAANQLTWWQKGEKRQVAFDQIIKLKRLGETRVKIYYAKRSGQLLKVKRISIRCDESSRALCEQTLERHRQGRPQRLLVFVNPFGGKGKALQLYKQRVRRLLDLADVESKLIITKYANHARDTIEDPLFDVEDYDAIVCVGGDGMFSELMNGLLFRYNRDKILTNELNLLDLRQRLLAERQNLGRAWSRELLDSCADGEDEEADDRQSRSSSERPRHDNRINEQRQASRLQRSLELMRQRLGGIGEQFRTPPIPVGVIGAGSTDCNAFGLLGTNDVITATLNIILGNQIQVDVCSIHTARSDRLLRFVSTFIAYGYFGDVIRESERLRWLGPSRYDLTGLNTLLKNQTYNGRVRILRSAGDGSPNDNPDERCHANCSMCKLHRHQEKPSAASEQLELIERQGPFVGVNAAVMACRCPQTRKGFSPTNHLANGCADLILVSPCSRVQYVNYLLRTGFSKKSAFDLKYVDAYRCRQFEFLACDSDADDNNLEESGDDYLSGDEHRAYRRASQAQQGNNNNKTNKLSSSAGSDSLTSSSHQSSNSNSLDAKQQQQQQQSLSSISPTDQHLEDLDLINGSTWNADGEILSEQSIRVKVNHKLLRVFGTGEPQWVDV